MGRSAKAKELREACRTDLARFCAAVPSGGGGKMQCLKAHRAELSASCKAFLASARRGA